MVWYYKNEEVIELPECIGFVYEITCIPSGRRYIGKKLKFFSKSSIKTVVLKSGIKRKKKVKTQIESDWRTYWSSSTTLKKDVEELGMENFSREILFYCQSKGALSYIEAREQFTHKVLEDVDLWYNGIISCRINRSHLIKYLDDLK
jgi:hypothetical protein